MKKRIICLLLCAVTLLPSLTAPVSAAPADETAQTPASEAANYLQQGDYFPRSHGRYAYAHGRRVRSPLF